MATVRALFMDADGFPKEVLPTADILSALSYIANPASPGDSIFDANQGKITDMAPGTLGTDAVNKSQLDSVAAGFDPKESCRVKTVASLSTWTPAGSGVGATLTAPTDATSFNDFDGVTLSLLDRVLVTFAGATEIADVQNGIYEVSILGDGAGASTVLTRTTDFDEDAEVTAGAFTFVTEGSTAADTGWYVITDDPIVVDTTAFAFSQFAGVGAFTGGDGIDIAAGVISVDLEANGAGEGGLAFDAGELRVDPGLGLELTAAGVAADLEAAGAGTGGLAFQGNEIRVDADTAAGIELTAQGVAINLEATNPSLAFVANEVGVKFDAASALTKDAGGLQVVVDGTTIQINGSNQLEVLGAADANSVKNPFTVATGGVTIGDPVYVSATDTVDDADAAAGVGTAILAFGVALTTEIAAATVQVVSEGMAVGVINGLGFTAGDTIYLAAPGGLTATPPTGNNDRMLMGYAANATDLMVKTQFLGKGRP